MKKLYSALYDILSPIVFPYLTSYPFQDGKVDLKKGLCTFYILRHKNITQGSQTQIDNETARIAAVVQLDVQVDLIKLVDHKDEHTPETIASKLQTYLKSTEALALFDVSGFDLAPVWGDIRIDTQYEDFKRWVTKASFDVTFYASAEMELKSAALKEINVTNTQTINK